MLHLSAQTNAAGDSITTQYDLAGQAVSVTDANGNTTNTYYDKLGRAIKVTTPFNNTASGETKTYYDKNSNVTKTAVKRSANTYQTAEYKYDNMGNLLASIAKGGNTDAVTQYQYDTANRVTKMITGLSSYSENPTGGAVTQYSYNNLGYLAKIIDPMGMEETYNSYDYAGNLLSLTDKNSNTMHNEYGPYGLVKSYFDNSPETKEYTYNDLGQLTAIKSVNANEQAVEESYEYDAFSRLISSTSNDGSVQNYTYDANSNVTAYELKKDDEVKNSAEYSYNALNQLTTLTSNGIITSYTYDANGNLTNKSLSTGVNTEYTYNKAGLMTYMKSKKGSETYTYSDCSYLLNGLIQQIDMPDKIKYYWYDNMGRLRDEMVDYSNDYWETTYQYDARGNISEKYYSGINATLSDTTSYEYDLNNRLLNANCDTYDSSNQKHSYTSTRYYYDNNGNMTAKQGSSTANAGMSLSGRSTDTGMSIYRYDAFNRLTKYNSGSAEASYTYNANNLRASKTVNRETTSFVWNGQNLAAENKDGSTNTYTYDITGVHIANRNGNVTSYLKDYHGNIVGTTTVAGAMVEEKTGQMDYDAFGNRWQGDTPDPFGYCGEYLDNESGLIYLRNRYYDSEMGRFITEDPVKDGLNWYAYCGNEPIMNVDPSGLHLLLQYDDGNIIDYLNNLSDDHIYIEDGEIKYNETGNSSYPTATSLIRRIINDDKTCVIKLDDPVRTGTGANEYVDYLGENVNSVIHFNTGYAKGVTLMDGSNEADSQGKDTIKMMELAHELIHSLRNFGRNNKSGQMVYGNTYNGTIQEASAEEFETIGLNYKTKDGRFVETTTWLTTENRIRSERGLQWRGRAL